MDRKAAFLQRMADRPSSSPLSRSVVVSPRSSSSPSSFAFSAGGNASTPRMASATPLPTQRDGDGSGRKIGRRKRTKRAGPIHSSDPDPFNKRGGKRAFARPHAQQRTTFSASDVRASSRYAAAGPGGGDQAAAARYSAAAARADAQSALRSLIRQRNDYLRAVMRKHTLSGAIVANLKQAQKQHNLSVLALVFERNAAQQQWPVEELINRLTIAGDSHVQVMTAMMQQGQASPIAVAEVQGLCNETHALIVRVLPGIVQSMLVEHAPGASLSASGEAAAAAAFSGAPNAGAPTGAFYAAVKGVLARRASQDDEDEGAFEDPLQVQTKEASEDLQAAQKVHDMLFRQAARKHDVPEHVVEDLAAAQSAHHDVMSELLLTHKLHHVEIADKLRSAHADHADRLKHILAEHGVAKPVADDIVGVHSSTTNVIDDLAERAVMARKALLKMVDEEAEAEMDHVENSERDAGGDASAAGASSASETTDPGNKKSSTKLSQMLVSAMREELKAAKNKQLDVERKLVETEGQVVSLNAEKDAWLIEKKRTDEHLLGVHAELKAASEETVRLRRERSDLESKYLSEKADLELEVRTLTKEGKERGEETESLRKVVHELHTALKTLTDGARGAMNEAEVQADEMADEISRLKQDLILAKQYKLHTVMEKVTKAGMKEQARLKRIIAHMQAEKLAMQTILVDAENRSDQAFETVRRLSSKMERMKVGGGTRSAGGSASSPSAREDAENAFVNERIALHSESRKARAESYAERARQIVEKQMSAHKASSSPEEVQEQYRVALSQIRRERDDLAEHAQQLQVREDAITHREREISVEAQRTRGRLSAAAVALQAEHGRLAEEARSRVDTLFEAKSSFQQTVDARENHAAERKRQQVAHDLVMGDIAHSHELNHVVASEINLVQRQHHKAMEELHRQHDAAAISGAVRDLQEKHAAQIDDIFEHHDVHPDTAAQLRSVHSHHHDLMHDLMVRQKQASEAGGSSHEPVISTARNDIHKSVQQVHSIVMEEVMKKHALHHVVVRSFSLSFLWLLFCCCWWF